jgi:signal transduction histidine kinase
VEGVPASPARAQPERCAEACAAVCAEACVRGDALHAILEVDPSGVALLSGDGLTIQLANRAFRAATPDPAIDPVGLTVEAIWPTEAGLELRATLERVRASGEAARLERLDVGGPDGAPRRFAYHAQPLPGREAATILLVLWETTDVELARSQAERSRERAELIASVAAELNAGASLDAVISTALTRAAALLGAEDGSLWLLGPDGRELQCASELLPRGRLSEPGTLESRPAASAAAADHTARLVRVEAAAGAEARWLQEHGLTASLVAPLALEGRPTGVLYLHYGPDGFLPGAHDVAFAEAIAVQCALAVGRARVFEAERAARARAEAAEREARRAERLQERLAAVLGHDLRTPLQVLALGVSILERRDGLSEADRKTLTRMATSAANMQRMVADLLDFARVRAGDRIPVAFEPVRLDEIVRAAVQELQAARGGAVELVVDGDAALDGDAARLGQLASNLVGHALREAPAGARVRAEVEGVDGEVVLTVHANGLVLEPGALTHLFEPFARASGDALHGNLNLGFFIVREIARAHGGRLEIAPGERATHFAVRLPRWHGERRPADAAGADGRGAAAVAAERDEAEPANDAELAAAAIER